MNKSTLTNHLIMCKSYTKVAFTHDYIFCFIVDKTFWAVKMDKVSAETLVLLTKVDRASSKRGGYMTLRFRPTTSIKRSIIEMGNVVYKCSAAAFLAECAASKYNKGEIAEKVVTEQVFGEKWVKDSVPFTDGADVSHYQIKFQSATFCTERQLLS